MNRRILTIDGFIIRLFGLPYLRLTRDILIHQRCRYLVTQAREIGRKELRVLDVGCGSGLALYYLERFCRSTVYSYVGIDIDVERLPKRWDFVKLPHCFRRIDLDDNWDFGQFDLIWCSEVMEHIINDEGLFHQMACHLTESGRLIITTPSRAFVEKMGQAILDFDRVSPVQDGGHVRKGYELRDFGNMAQRNNLFIASRAWLSPCSEADLRVRCKSDFVGWAGALLMNLTASGASLVRGKRGDRGAENCFSLGVSLAKESEKERAEAAVPKLDVPRYHL